MLYYPDRFLNRPFPPCSHDSGTHSATVDPYQDEGRTYSNWEFAAMLEDEYILRLISFSDQIRLKVTEGLQWTSAEMVFP
jgi:hypothetical protein